MLLSPSPGLVQASFLSGPSDGKLPLVYTPLDLSVAKGQLFAGAWTKLRHMDRGAHAWARVEGGEGELNAGAEYLLSITPRHTCRNQKVPPGLQGCYQNIFAMQEHRTYVI